MRDNFFEIYDAIAGGVESSEVIEELGASSWWSSVGTGSRFGVAMTTPGESAAPMFPQGLSGMKLTDAAKAAASWNLTEAGYGLAAANAFYNSPERIEALGCAEPFVNYCTAGLELDGKRVCFVGHMSCPKELRERVGELHILERHPQPGDLPDSACDWIIPRCDIVLITGSSLVNKTLPHLLELCRDAYTILTGPSVPLCPALLELGIDRIAGMAVIDRAGMSAHIASATPGSPYRFGSCFMLKR